MGVASLRSRYFSVGISQRHCDNYYEFLNQDRSQIIQDIIQFQNGNVAGKFPLKDCNQPSV